MKEVIPGVRRMTLMFNPETAPYYPVFLREFFAGGSPLAAEVSVSPVRNEAEIEAAATAFAREPGGGLIAAPDAFINTYRALIISLAHRHRLPTLFGFRQHVRDGGLMSYGPNSVEIVRQSASYVDRILKGEKPAELPVQAAYQVRTGDQPQNGQGARPRRAADAARPRRRGDRMNKRREFITLLGGAAAAWPLTARAQQAAKVSRLGVLLLSTPQADPQMETARRALHDLGYVEGHNLSIEYRYAGGRPERLPDLAADLVRTKPDVLFALGGDVTPAAVKATHTIPIVFTSSADPVRLDSSRVSPDRAAMPPASPFCWTNSRPSGSRFSNRRPLAFRVWASCGIRITPTMNSQKPSGRL